MKLTERQADYLRTMRIFFNNNDQLPPGHVLAEIMQVKNNAAFSMMGRLERMGYIEKNVLGKYKRGILWSLPDADKHNASIWRNK
jgi:Mn-dependent DtxR family transcriptional regulator